MTDKSMNLIEAVGKCGDSDLLRQLAEAALVKLMEFEVEQRIGTTRHERSAERSAYAGMVTALLKQVFSQPDQAAARTLWRQVADQLRGKFPKAALLLDEAEDDVLAFMGFPRCPSRQDPLDQSLGASQQGSKAAIERGRHLSGRRQHHASGRCRAHGAAHDWIQGKRYLTLGTLAEVVPSSGLELRPPAVPV